MEFEPGKELLVEPPRLVADAGAAAMEYELRITQGKRQQRISVRFDNVAGFEPRPTVEAVLALALLPAMKLGSPLRVRGEIDQELVESLREYQDILNSWYPEFHIVPVIAENPVVRPIPMNDSRGVGVFFSGGVDSNYTMLKHREEITHAVFIHGCDVPLDRAEYRARSSRALGDAARNIGLPLIEVETDLLAFSNTYTTWAPQYHGCALAAIAMLLGGGLRKMYIASSDTFIRSSPWGSTPLTDRLWATVGLRIVNDGSEKNRFEKIESIATHEGALEHLRVCFEAPEAGYNCGVCEKCLRNMVVLAACGLLERCPAFDRPLDLKALASSEPVRARAKKFKTWQVAYDEAVERDADPELVAVLKEIYMRGEFDKTVHRLARNREELMASSVWREALPKFRGRLFKSLRDEDPEWFSERVEKWLPEAREGAFERLWQHDRRWFKRRYRQARWARLLQRLRGG